MKRERIITANTTLDDIDLVDTYIKCTSETTITLTLPAVSSRKLGADSIIVNFGAGTVTAAGVDIVQGGHGHIVCDNGTSWKVALGGGGAETDPIFSASPAVGIDLTDITNWDTAHSHSQSAHAPVNAQKNSDITKEEIEAKLIGEITSHSHAGSGGAYYEPLVNGDLENPDIMFDDDGDIIMVEV